MLEEWRGESGCMQRRDEKEAFEEETRTRMMEGKEPEAVRCTNNGNVDDRDVYRRELLFEYTRALKYMHLDVSIQSVGKPQT